MDFENKVRLEYFLQRLRQKMEGEFCRLFNNTINKEWNPKDSSTFFKSSEATLYSNFKPIQRKLIDGGIVECWDITMLCNILRSSSSLPFGNRWKKGAAEVSNVRNKIAHTSSIEIGCANFEGYWKTLKRVYVSFGGSGDEVDMLKNTPLKDIVNSGDETSDAARELHQAGNEYFRRGQFENAIAEYTKALTTPNVAVSTPIYLRGKSLK